MRDQPFECTDDGNDQDDFVEAADADLSMAHDEEYVRKAVLEAINNGNADGLLRSPEYCTVQKTIFQTINKLYNDNEDPNAMTVAYSLVLLMQFHCNGLDELAAACLATNARMNIDEDALNSEHSPEDN